ncbi:MAG TPA: hypothetical protein V6D22_12260 [Candidatus Obscuribacterales bacterium]
MNKDDIRRATTLILLIVLAYTAPQWLAPGHARTSNYDAPWVYPGLAPSGGSATSGKRP